MHKVVKVYSLETHCFFSTINIFNILKTKHESISSWPFMDEYGHFLSQTNVCSVSHLTPLPSRHTKFLTYK